MAHGLDNGGIIGEGIAVGLLVGTEKKVEREDLGRLNKTQTRAVEGDRGLRDEG